ncbi:hypothetical protein [Methylobacterium sp.]|jgi:hypothetical protein|uniref:hypothetical protein n=1 Tax=Methylobacterium sp. TaxID=409 RepID=UPI000C6765B0|nr:hypothetical protein [Methylobacterium sp.]MBP27832.1 hypothetical protein [Methylobacterium sp.]
MPACAQAIHDEYLNDIYKSARHPSLLDRAKAWEHARETATLPLSANDDAELDAWLMSLPVELEHIPRPVVTDLDGNHVEHEPHHLLPSPRLKRILVTKRSSERLPKSQARDRKDRAVRIAYRRSAVTSATHPLTGPLAKQTTPDPANANTPSQTLSSTPSKSRKGGRPKKSRARLIANWNEAGDLSRLDYVNRAGALWGKPFAWTLNISPDVEKVANDDARGALNYLARRVRLHLDRQPALRDERLLSWMVIETTNAGRPHLHGAVFTDNPELLPSIREALTKAGGVWNSKAGHGYQTDLGPQRHLDDWSAYPLKRQGRTRRHLREAAGLPADTPVQIATWSRELIPDAKRLLAEERRKIGRT